MDVVVTCSDGSTTVGSTARNTNQFSKSLGADVDFRWSSEGGLNCNIMARETLVQYGGKCSLFCCDNVISLTTTKTCRFTG